MGLAKNDDMIQALAADRPDQPFDKAILKDRRLHPIHPVDHDSSGLRMCSTHCMDASSRWLTGGLPGVRNASIFMTIMAT